MTEDSYTLDNLNVNSYKVDIIKLPNFNFKVKNVDTPSYTLAPLKSPNPFQVMNIPGDTVEYGSFSMNFIIDENLYNYCAIVNWLEGLGFPDSFEQFKALMNDDSDNGARKKGSYTVKETSDIYLHLLTNHRNSNRIVKMYNAFPVSLSGFNLNNSNTESVVIEATVEFAFTGMKYIV